jgi:uncharacterized iron-regulated protein
MAIGLECFYRQHQGALDRFVFSHQDMGTLKRETSWTQSWGYDLNYYAKIFNFAAQRQIRLVGLNVPYPVAKLVSQVGLDGIPPKLRTLLPPVDLSVKKHKDQFVQAMSVGMHSANIDADALDRMYQTQTVSSDVVEI